MKGKFKISHLRRFLLLGIISTIILTGLPVYGESLSSYPYNLEYLYQIMELIQDNYAYDISSKELMEGSIKGLFLKLDDNSQYYTEEEFQGILNDTSGNFVGIGIQISQIDGKIEVIEPIKGGPASKIGIRAGDIIMEVDETPVKGLDLVEVSNLIRGEIGSKVKIKVQRGQRSISYNIVRKKIEVNPVEYEILEDNLAYIRISQFNTNTSKNLGKLLKELDKQKITNIIVDLRDNPGGLLSEVVESLKFFIPEGPLVHIKFRDDLEQTYYSKLKYRKYKLAVLVNENSASASEIFAGAVQDTQIGKIIGRTSFGKGTVQQIIPLSQGDGIKLTVAEYLTPKKRNINQTGIQPDIIIEKNQEDQILKTAKKTLLSF